MKARPLFISSAIVELTAGLALIVVPTFFSGLLLGASLDTAGLVVARIAGTALSTLGMLCWRLSVDASGHVIRALLAAMLLYNVAVVVVLVYASLVLNLNGIGIWPASVFHAAMAVWGLACLYTAVSAR